MWPLTEGSGSRIYDSTGKSAHTGSLQNMTPVWISGSEGGIPLGITGYSDKMYFDGVHNILAVILVTFDEFQNNPFGADPRNTSQTRREWSERRAELALVHD